MMYFAAFLPDSFDKEYRRCIERRQNKMENTQIKRLRIRRRILFNAEHSDGDQIKLMHNFQLTRITGTTFQINLQVFMPVKKPLLFKCHCILLPCYLVKEHSLDI